METTPDWVLLTIAGLGLLGTLAGVLVTQRWSDRREAANLAREQEREQERWRREDEARTFDHRRVAYSDFYESLQRMARRAYDYGMGLSDEDLNDEGELPWDWQLPTFDSLQLLQLYATPSVAEAANDAYNAAWKWGHEASPGVDDAEFYRRQDDYNVAEDAVTRNPVANVKRPKVGTDTVSTGLDKDELGALVRATEADSPRSHALVLLLGLNGLRVSEILGADVQHLSTERGHRVLYVTRKGGKRSTVPLAPRTADALDAYIEGRCAGPLFITATAKRWQRSEAWRTLRRLARDAVPTKADTIHPHDLRHAFVTLSLDTGASLRDVQDAAGHADPRTTRRYDRSRHNLDRHPTYALAGLLS